jgi:hypothetical protein
MNKISLSFSQILKTIMTSSLLGTGLLLSQITSVQALTFNWSFSNVIGGVNGTVSGRLEVPEGNGVAASSVVLTSTTNPLFNSLVGFDFTTVPNFQNQFNVTSGQITAAYFGTDFFSNTTNLSLEFNTGIFGDTNSQNLGLFTTAGNPLPITSGGNDICPVSCLQTASLFGDNTGATEFAPTFTPVPESSPAIGLLVTLGLVGINQLRRLRAHL